MDIEKATERCNQLIKPEHANWIGISNQIAISTVLSELEKKEAIINEMAKWLYEDDTSFGYGNLKSVNTPEKIKQYFTKKVEGK